MSESIPAIKPEIEELARKIKPLFSRGEGSTVNVSSDLVEAAYGAEEAAAYRKTQKRERDLVAATGLAFSQFNLDIMGADKDVDHLSFRTAMGENELHMRQDRKKEYINPRDNTPVTRYGTLKVAMSSKSVGNTGQLNVVRRHNHVSFSNLK